MMSVLAGSGYALGKVDIGVYGGGMTSIFSGGRDFGAQLLVSPPFMKVGAEVERTYAYAFNNSEVTITKLGILAKKPIVAGFTSLTLSAGMSTVISGAAFTLGTKTFGLATPVTGQYASIGLEIMIKKLMIHPKFVYNIYSGEPIAEAVLNCGFVF